VSLKFEKSTINTPQLMTELNLPDYTTVLGQNVDLRWVKSILQPLDDASRDVRKQVHLLILSGLCCADTLLLPILSFRAQLGRH
jgi:transcriptional accessory protein Tex/SPT6